LSKIRKSPRKIILAASILFGSILFSSCSNTINKESNSTNNISNKNEIKFTPASREEMYFYKQIGVTYFCLARQAKVEFPKSISIASNNFALIVTNKHGGLIEEVGDQKLTNDQLLQGSYLQLIEGAINLCPDEVPEDERSKFLSAVEKLNQNNLTINKE
tara:strand:- start:78 stop:557 length:480 start_codon:yes stop_codon:yes gene_type:complete